VSALVQVSRNNSGASGGQFPTSIAATFGSNNTAGHLLVAQAGFLNDDVSSIFSDHTTAVGPLQEAVTISDTQGNTWTRLGYTMPGGVYLDGPYNFDNCFGVPTVAGSGVPVDGSGNPRTPLGDSGMIAYYCWNCKAGANVVTASGFHASGTFQRQLNLVVSEYSGIKSSGDPLLAKEVGATAEQPSGPQYYYRHTLSTAATGMVLVLYYDTDGWADPSQWTYDLSGMSTIEESVWGNYGQKANLIAMASGVAAGSLSFTTLDAQASNLNVRYCTMSMAFEETGSVSGAQLGSRLNLMLGGH